MNDVAQQVSESVAETVATTTQAAIETVEARAAAAEAANEALTDAAIRDRLSGRIDDCEEGLAECQSDQEELAGDLQALETETTQNAMGLTALRATVEQMNTQLQTLAGQSHSIQPNSEGDQPKASDQPKSETVEDLEKSPKNEEEEGREKTEAPRVPEPKKRGTLL